MLFGSSHLAMMASGGVSGLGPTPVIETTATTAEINTQSFSWTMPASINVGDIIVVICSIDGDHIVTVDTGVSGSNWNLTTVVTNNAAIGSVLWKVAEGSDVLTVGIDGGVNERGTAVSYRISGAETVDLTSVTGNSTNINPPDHTPAGGSKNYLWIAAGSMNQGNINALPTNYSNFLNEAGSGGGAETGSGDRALTAASENPGIFFSNSGEWIGWTIAVHPV